MCCSDHVDSAWWTAADETCWTLRAPGELHLNINQPPSQAVQRWAALGSSRRTRSPSALRNTKAQTPREHSEVFAPNLQRWIPGCVSTVMAAPYMLGFGGREMLVILASIKARNRDATWTTSYPSTRIRSSPVRRLSVSMLTLTLEHNDSIPRQPGSVMRRTENLHFQGHPPASAGITERSV